MSEFTYSDPIETVAFPSLRNIIGYVRYTSRQAVSVALQKEYLSDQQLGTLNAPNIDITEVNGQYVVDTGSSIPQDWHVMSTLLMIADAQIRHMADVATITKGD